MAPNFRRDHLGIICIDSKGSELVYHQPKDLQYTLPVWCCHRPKILWTWSKDMLLELEWLQIF